MQRKITTSKKIEGYPPVGFKDRSLETQILKEYLESKGFQFIILYGRRRIGKTELVKEATRGQQVIYYFAHETNNLHRFAEACAQVLPLIRELVPDYKVLFNYLKGQVDVIIIDEFQNMLKEDPSFNSSFAEIIDDLRRNQVPLKLIILGSSVSMITSRVLSDPSPLFGRKTLSLKLGPVAFFDLNLFFPQAGFKELIEIYGFADGIPYYLCQIDKPFWDWISHGLQFPGWFPIDELDFLLRIEFTDIRTYKEILFGIASGHTTLNEIRNFLDQQGFGEGILRGLSNYLRILIEVGLIIREVPITEPPNSRLGRYYLMDNFLRFWFRFIYPNWNLVQYRTLNMQTIHADFPSYLGAIFEQVVTQYLIKTQWFRFVKIGRWWGRTRQIINGKWHSSVHEIDLLAFDDQSPRCLAVECKWQENIDAYSIAKNLLSKTQHIEFKGKYPHKQFTLAVFARSFIGYEKEFFIENIQVRCFDIKELEDTFAKGD